MKLRVEAPEKKYVSCVGMVRSGGEGEFEVSALEDQSAPDLNIPVDMRS